MHETSEGRDVHPGTHHLIRRRQVVGLVPRHCIPGQLEGARFHGIGRGETIAERVEQLGRPRRGAVVGRGEEQVTADRRECPFASRAAREPFGEDRPAGERQLLGDRAAIGAEEDALGGEQHGVGALGRSARARADRSVDIACIGDRRLTIGRPYESIGRVVAELVGADLGGIAVAVVGEPRSRGRIVGGDQLIGGVVLVAVLDTIRTGGDHLAGAIRVGVIGVLPRPGGIDDARGHIGTGETP